MMEAINWWGSLSISSKTYLECLCTVTISLMTFIPTLTKERRELVSTIFWGLDSYTCLHMTWQATGFLFSKYLLERSCRSRSWISFCTVFKKIHLNSKRSKHNEKHRSFNFFYLNYIPSPKSKIMCPIVIINSSISLIIIRLSFIRHSSFVHYQLSFPSRLLSKSSLSSFIIYHLPFSAGADWRTQDVERLSMPNLFVLA